MTKQSALRSQKRPKTFDKQVLQAIDERRAVEFGMEELKGRKRWDYFDGITDYEVSAKPKVEQETDLGGVKAEFSYNSDQNRWVYTLFTKMRANRRFAFNPNLHAAISNVAAEVSDYQGSLMVHSELFTPNQDQTVQTYRAASYFMGKPQFDWGMFRFKEDASKVDAIMPAHIRCFIDLRGLPLENTTKYKPAIYMIVETVKRNATPEELRIQEFCELFQPYVKTKERIRGTTRWVAKMKMMCVDQLEGPARVCPDLDNTHPNAWLRVKPMDEWAQFFAEWVNDPHGKEFEEQQDVETV